MSVAVVGRGRWLRLRAGIRLRVGRPVDIVERTRWLFFVLGLGSLLLALPAPLASADASGRVVALVATMALAASWSVGYLRRSAPRVLDDVIDAAAVFAIALVCPQPVAAFSVVFAAIWFRSVYGSTARSLVRCGLLAAAIGGSLPLWPYVSGHSGAVDARAVLGVIPVMFLTVVIGRHLAGNLSAREQAAQRDAVYGSLGSSLLGVTDAAEIRRLAWSALEEIAAATPGLRLLRATAVDSRLRVERAVGPVAVGRFAVLPVDLPAEVTVLDGEEVARPGVVSGAAALDAAVGAQLCWESLLLPTVNGELEISRIVMGAPRATIADAVLSVGNLINQVSLALRNSDVHQELTEQATLDSLTGLANRAAFNAAVAARLDAAGGTGPRPTVLFIDLDDFKDVNDVLGHGSGDQVLREVAARLRRATRPDDLCARLGGDEFGLLLSTISSPAAAELAQRVVDAVAVPAHVSGGIASVGASVGVATAISGMNLEQLVQSADVAMYAAKANGKGRVQVFTDGLLHVDSGQMDFERQLGSAAQHGELVVHYQPVVPLAGGRCSAVEALVRWQHPERGLLYPSAFLELAERIGAIRDVGAYVLSRACADAAQWRLEHPGIDLAMHVNVSALQLDDVGFIDRVFGALREANLPAESLVLEVTETAVLADPAAMVRLKNLAAGGVRIAVDDFGTGYSALTTLRALPIGTVKIDTSFVAGSMESAGDRAVIEAVVKMAQQMGMTTIAEGVERIDQHTYLAGIGVDAAQGFLFQRPVDAVAFGSWLDGHLSDVTPADHRSVLAFPHRAAAER